MGLVMSDHGNVSVELRRESFIIHAGYDTTPEGKPATGPHAEGWRRPHPEFLKADLDDLIAALVEARERLRATGERTAGRAKFKIRPADEVDKDLVWHCATCGAHGPAEPPYELGDKEKCTRCGDAWSVVMTLKDAAKIECEVARRLRSGQGGGAAVGASLDATKEDGQ